MLELSNIGVSNVLDCDGDIELEIDLNYSLGYTYFGRGESLLLIKHLIKIFKITPEELL